jgi:nucleoside-diphosphate-sugar epimerase
MNKLAQEVLSISGSMSKISYQKIPQDDPRTRTPDIKRANDHLNWFPKVGREEGLARTIEYFREIL